MVGQSRKWLILVAATWIQASTGTNFDFSSYSSTLKSVLGISQVQLNYLSVASDVGKAFGWCAGICLWYLPLWTVLFMAAFLGLFGYGLQWLLISQIISMPYFLVFLLCLLAGCSIAWFNTVCFVLCIRNFPTHRAVALSLTIGFNSLTAALYTLLANAIDPESNTVYLFLNAFIPLFISCLVLIPIMHQPALQPPTHDTIRHDSINFLILFVFAVMTGLYLLLLDSLSSNASLAWILLAGACVLFILPLCFPGVICAIDWGHQNIHTRLPFDCPTFYAFNHEEVELQEELISSNNSSFCSRGKYGFLSKVMEKDRLKKLGDEHPARLLVRKWDFWLYYLAYLCGGTLGMVYSNNLGQIAQSLGHYSHLSSLVTLYSSCSFFGRLLSAAPDFLQDKVYFARTGWLAVALVPTTIGFFLLSASGSIIALQAGTGMIGLSSGFIFSAAVSITSELFGYNSMSVNHNILITNIPIGSLLYGLLAALIYDSKAASSLQEELLGDMVVCMGRHCYAQTFVCWGCISLVGLISSLLLFLRTQPAYDHLFERNQSGRQLL